MCLYDMLNDILIRTFDVPALSDFPICQNSQAYIGGESTLCFDPQQQQHGGITIPRSHSSPNAYQLFHENYISAWQRAFLCTPYETW